nr:hypothetical protein [Frigoriglobus tundricola]
MRERGDAVGGVNEADRLLDGHEHLGPHRPGERAQQPVERLGPRACVPARHEQRRDVAPPRARRCFNGGAHPLVRQGRPGVTQARDVVPVPFAPGRAHGREGGVQVAVVGADEVPEQVELAAGERGADLDAGNDLEVAPGRGAGRGDAGERVVVRHRDRAEPGPPGLRNDFRGCVLSVAQGGVNVQVRAGRCGQLGQSAAEQSKGGAFRHRSRAEGKCHDTEPDHTPLR